MFITWTQIKKIFNLETFLPSFFKTFPHLEFKKNIYTNFKSKKSMEVLILRYF